MVFSVSADWQPCGPQHPRVPQDADPPSGRTSQPGQQTRVPS